jgi:arginyl-tRNA synthetase
MAPAKKHSRKRKTKAKAKAVAKAKRKTKSKTKSKVSVRPGAKPAAARSRKVKAKVRSRKAAAKTVAKRKVKTAAKPKAKRGAKAAPKPKAAVNPEAKAAPAPRPQPARPHLFADMLARVRAAAAAVLGAQADLSRIVVEPPRDPSHGDMATNAAMVLAKDAGQKPRDLAERIAEKLRSDGKVQTVDVAGPGFINLTLKAGVWPDALRVILQQGKAYGKSTLGGGHKVNVEYVSANPTGPLHVGHCRGAVFGDALASLLAFAGFAVTREYYINDAGAQVDVLARSAFLRYREALGEDIGEIPEGLYPGDYLKECGAELANDYGDALKKMPEAEWLPIVRLRATDMMMAEIRNDLARLHIVPDVFFSERSLIEGELPDPFSNEPPTARADDVVAETIEQLRSAGHVYEGRLPPPKSGNLEDWEDREQTLFRSTAFGDDVDRPLRKSDGSYTYFATDIAYHKSKFDRGFSDMIDVWGADHGGYIKRMQAAVKAVSGGKAALDVKLVQLVRLLRAGEPVKMSKRAGDYVTLREVVEEVGRSAVRFDMLYRKNDAPLDFDLAKVIEQSRENPVFYVQYGHARGASIFRTAKVEMPGLPLDEAALKDADLARLSDAGEISILRKLALYPRLIEAAAAVHEPHRVAFYLYELASEFHGQWSRGKESPHLRFIIQDDPETTVARLALVQGIVTVLASGLALLGVEAPQEMR